MGLNEYPDLGSSIWLEIFSVACVGVILGLQACGGGIKGLGRDQSGLRKLSVETNQGLGNIIS